MNRRTLIVTGADLAPQALALLAEFEVVYAGRAPQKDDLITLCRRHDPVAIIVRYGSVGAEVMDVRLPDAAFYLWAAAPGGDDGTHCGLGGADPGKQGLTLGIGWLRFFVRGRHGLQANLFGHLAPEPDIEPGGTG